MKYSIIIVSYQAEDCLRRCIDSINASGIRDAEIIIWDNSLDPIFEKKSAEPWSTRLPLYTYYNGINHGFAEGCNKAARQARGEYLIFLNPDTQVFGNWADEMAKYFALKTAEGKPIGAVGPISNYVAGLQDAKRFIACPMEGHAGITTKLLIGFCFIIPIMLWRDLGGMDPKLFLGCDDLDLSMRIREAGFELVIASDVFVHHEGHKSIEAAGMDNSMLLIHKTEDRFRAKLLRKYGSQEAIPSSEQLWGCPIFYTGPLTPQTLSIVMIVRDEESNLIELLPQLEFADEIVIVDTKPMAERREGASIEEWAGYIIPNFRGRIKGADFPWVDDFAKARNHALSLATGDYVLWLDADDRVPEESRALIRAMLDKPGPLTAQKKCHFAFTLKDYASEGGLIEVSQPRLFPRIEGLYWEQPIHEIYGDRAIALGLAMVTPTNIIIEHHGYKDPDLMRRKQKRNIAMLNKAAPSPHKYMHLGNSRMAIHEYAEARQAYLKLLALEPEWPGGYDPALVAHIRYMMAASFYKEFMAELKAWQGRPNRFRGDMPEFPPEIELLVKDNAKPDSIFLLAEHYFFNGKIDMAREHYKMYAAMEITDSFGTNQSAMHAGAEGRLAAIEEVNKSLAASNSI